MRPGLQKGSDWESLKKQGLKQPSSGRPGRKTQAEPETWARKQKSVPTMSGSQQNERLNQKSHAEVWQLDRGKGLSGGLGGASSTVKWKADGWSN